MEKISFRRAREATERGLAGPSQKLGLTRFTGAAKRCIPTKRRGRSKPNFSRSVVDREPPATPRLNPSVVMLDECGLPGMAAWRRFERRRAGVLARGGRGLCRAFADDSSGRIR